ncbi:MAG: hypothetical protein K0Q72_66, partial [Armatimonadetes bacterium]|nr:hypothetical protein [Armatimonadota bacterium]
FRRDEAARDAARAYLVWATQDDAPHAGMTRQYLREKTSTLGRAEIVHPKVSGEQARAAWLIILERAPELSAIL